MIDKMHNADTHLMPVPELKIRLQMKKDFWFWRSSTLDFQSQLFSFFEINGNISENYESANIFRTNLYSISSGLYDCLSITASKSRSKVKSFDRIEKQRNIK